MEPAVTARKAVETKITDTDPAVFDAERWIKNLKSKGMKAATVKLKLHYRTDLIPRIQELAEEIDRLQTDEDREVGLDDVDELGAAAVELRALEEEFRDGGFEEFEFRPRNRRIQDDTYRAWQAAGYDDENDTDRRHLMLMRMSATCLSHPGITPEAWEAFEDEYGDTAFGLLLAAFIEGYTAGGEPDAPFLRKLSHTQGTTG